MARWHRTLIAIGLASVLGCAPSSETDAEPQSAGNLGGSGVAAPSMGGEFGAERLTVSKNEVDAGDELGLAFEAPFERGITWRLERQLDDEGGSWELAYVLTSDATGVEPQWGHPEDGLGGEDVAVDHPGVDSVIVPPGAPAGVYRLASYTPGDPLRLESESFTVKARS